MIRKSAKRVRRKQVTDEVRRCAANAFPDFFPDRTKMLDLLNRVCLSCLTLD